MPDRSLERRSREDEEDIYSSSREWERTGETTRRLSVSRLVILAYFSVRLLILLNSFGIRRRSSSARKPLVYIKKILPSPPQLLSLFLSLSRTRTSPDDRYTCYFISYDKKRARRFRAFLERDLRSFNAPSTRYPPDIPSPILFLSSPPISYPTSYPPPSVNRLPPPRSLLPPRCTYVSCGAHMEGS